MGVGRPPKKIKNRPVHRIGAKALAAVDKKTGQEHALLDVDEVTALLRCSRDFLKQSVGAGLIRIVQSKTETGSVLYSEPDVLAFAGWLKDAAASPTPVTTPGVPWVDGQPESASE